MRVHRRLEAHGPSVSLFERGALVERRGNAFVRAVVIVSMCAASACSEKPAKVDSVSLAVPVRQPEEVETGRTVLLTASSEEVGRRVALTATGCEIDLTDGAQVCTGSTCCIGVPTGLFAFVVRKGGGECLVRADLVERDPGATADVDGTDASDGFRDRCSGIVVTSAVPVTVAFPGASDSAGDSTTDTADSDELAETEEAEAEVETDEVEVGP